MKRHIILSCALSAFAVLLASSAAQAQHTQHNTHRFQAQSGSRFVVPSYNNSGGSYYFRNNGYYYNAGGRNVKMVYGGFSHVDELCVRLESLANSFCLEIYYNYSRNPGFDDTYREAYEILEIAKYIHEEEHHGHRDEIAKELGGLDSLFHHVEDDVAHWHSNRGRHHHHGHVSKKEQLIEEMESVIHHLMHDVGVKSRNAPAPGNAPVPRRGGAPRPSNLQPRFNNLQP